MRSKGLAWRFESTELLTGSRHLSQAPRKCSFSGKTNSRRGRSCEPFWKERRRVACDVPFELDKRVGEARSSQGFEPKPEPRARNRTSPAAPNYSYRRATTGS